ncbi:MAG: DUF2306 domain-containing protein [Bacteroidetes bacterium]|nr:MAG: DUF2306 domain-containing protein [Bacteroidota bacterium]
MKLTRAILYALLVPLMLFFSYLMLDITLPFASFKRDVGFLMSKRHVWHHGYWRIAFYIHIFCSLPLIMAGTLQVIPAIRKRYLKLHRGLGRVYVYVILFLAAPSGFVLAIHANGGIWAQTSFTLLSVSWWVFTFLGWRAMKRGNESGHKAQMFRSYALTLSAIALRSYVFVIPAFWGINGKEMYVLVAWLSWVPNLLLVEAVLFFARRKRLRSGD